MYEWGADHCFVRSPRELAPAAALEYIYLQYLFNNVRARLLPSCIVPAPKHLVHLTAVVALESAAVQFCGLSRSTATLFPVSRLVQCKYTRAESGALLKAARMGCSQLAGRD